MIKHSIKMKTFLRSLILFSVIGFSIAVQAQDNTRFTLVRDVSELNDGDAVVIVDSEEGAALGKRTNNAKDCIYASNIDISGDEVTVNDDVQVFRLGKLSAGWRFHTGTSYLGGSSTNKLSFYENADEYSKASIKIDGGTATITFKSKYRIGYNYNKNASQGFQGLFKLYSAINSRISLYKMCTDSPSDAITLDGSSQSADNSSAISTHYNATLDEVTLQRTFVGDGGWYTVCLPFPLTEEDIREQFQGADFQEFTDVEVTPDNSLNLIFKRVSGTKAGVPYMVRPIEGTEIKNPVFTNKTITANRPETVTHACRDASAYECSFVGIFNPTAIYGRTIRFVSADGATLTVPANDGSRLKGFRAYMKMPDGNVSAKINSGDVTSGIISVERDIQLRHKGVYDLCGRYMGDSAENLRHGIYIVNGRKTVIK